MSTANERAARGLLPYLRIGPQYAPPRGCETVRVTPDWRPRPPRDRGELNRLLCARVPLRRYSAAYAMIQARAGWEVDHLPRPSVDRVTRLEELVWFIRFDTERRLRAATTPPRPAQRAGHLTRTHRHQEEARRV